MPIFARLIEYSSAAAAATPAQDGSDLLRVVNKILDEGRAFV